DGHGGAKRCSTWARTTRSVSRRSARDPMRRKLPAARNAGKRRGARFASPHLARLQAVETLVQASPCAKLRMRAALSHFTMVEHENLLRPHHGAETVRDRDR